MLPLSLQRSAPVCTTPILQRAESVTSDKTLRVRKHLSHCHLYWISKTYENLKSSSTSLQQFMCLSISHSYYVFHMQTYSLLLTHHSPPTPTPPPPPLLSLPSLQLFVKNVGSDMTPEEITELFSVYGQVFDTQKHPNRRNVAFVVSQHFSGAVYV